MAKDDARTLDLRKDALALRDSIGAWRTPPDRSARDTALHDAWESVLKPRLENLLGAADWFADASVWELDDDDRAARLREDRWDDAVRQASDLYVGLAGALAQMRNVRVSWKLPLRFGIVKGKPSATPKGKEAATARETTRKAAEAARRKGAEEAEAIAKSITEALDGARSLLAEQMRSVQRLLSKAQKAEEVRLKQTCSVCFQTDPARAEEVGLLAERMRVGRLNAESFDGVPASRYGTLLRQGWVLHRQRMLATLAGRTTGG